MRFNIETNYCKAGRSPLICFICYSVSLATGSLYVQRFFKENAKKKALELVDNIRQEMYEIIETVDWMDEDTR